MPDEKPLTKADLDQALHATTEEFKKTFTTKADLDQVKDDVEQLLADQATVILDAVDERLDRKLDEKFNPVINKLDGILKGVEALQQENIVGAEQLRRHDKQLKGLEQRVGTLEASTA